MTDFKSFGIAMRLEGLILRLVSSEAPWLMIAFRQYEADIAARLARANQIAAQGFFSYFKTIHIRVEGDKELIRALGGARSDFAKELRKALKKAADPVRAEAAGIATRWDATTASGYRVVANASVSRGIAVRVIQSQRKVTGLRPDYGSLQMRDALIPALAHHQKAAVDEIEHALETTLRRHGL